jgi:hypothetical protein
VSLRFSSLGGAGTTGAAGLTLLLLLEVMLLEMAGVVLRLYSTLPQFLASHPWNPVSNVVKSVSLKRKNPDFRVKLVNK